MRRTLALLEHYGRRFSEQVMDFAYRQFDTASSKWKSLRSGAASGPANPQVRREIPESQIPEGERVYAFGDIHGRADLLERLFDSVEADIEAFGVGEKVRLVFLGDYVDRGFQSKEVIDFLLSDRVAQYAPIFLKGNHEEAFLKFLSEPGFGPRWAGYGGAETLISYGVRPPRTRTQIDEWVEACEKLREVLPIEHRAFLTSLSMMTSIGDYVFVHAGLRPGRPVDQQVEDDVLWIRDEFLEDKSSFEQIVVHGHTPINEPYRDYRRVGIDTGAYLSGKLTAACFVRGEINFLTT